jgi:hypothetical protein
MTSNTPEVDVTMVDIYSRITALETSVNNLSQTIQTYMSGHDVEHDKMWESIVALDRFKWKMLGGTFVFGTVYTAILSVVVAYIISTMF